MPLTANHKNKKKDLAEQVGLVLLSLEAAWAEFAAWNPSFFTISKFSETPEDVEKIRQGLLAGVLTTGITGAGLFLVFGRRGIIPALAHVAVGGGMALFYNNVLEKKGIIAVANKGDSFTAGSLGSFL